MGADDLADFSSIGPAADGRIKPDLVAPGVFLPSSYPASTGAVNLLFPRLPQVSSIQVQSVWRRTGLAQVQRRFFMYVATIIFAWMHMQPVEGKRFSSALSFHAHHQMCPTHEPSIQTRHTFQPCTPDTPVCIPGAVQLPCQAHARATAGPYQARPWPHQLQQVLRYCYDSTSSLGTILQVVLKSYPVEVVSS